MDRIIMVAALLFVFGSAACRTPQQTEESRPPVEVGPLKGKDEGSSESDGEVRLAALERRVVELEALVAGMQERVERLQAKPPLPRLERAKSDLDVALVDFDGALELLAFPSSSEGER